MAITFEEKNNTVRDAAIVAGMAALLFGAGFFTWQSIQETPTVDIPAAAGKFKINKEILNDAQFAALELFPEIPAATVAAARENPFAKEAESESAAPAATAGQNESGALAE